MRYKIYTTSKSPLELKGGRMGLTHPQFGINAVGTLAEALAPMLPRDAKLHSLSDLPNGVICRTSNPSTSKINSLGDADSSSAVQQQIKTQEKSNDAPARTAAIVIAALLIGGFIMFDRYAMKDE